MEPPVIEKPPTKPGDPITAPSLPYDPVQASGQSYDYSTQSWKDVKAGGNPQLVYYGPTNQMYFNGQPISSQQYGALQSSGPGAYLPPLDENSGSYLTPDWIKQGITNLGIGQAPPTIKPPQVTPPEIKQLPPGAVAQASYTPASLSQTASGGTSTASQAHASLAGAPPTITAPHINAEQAGFKDFDALQKAIYESVYNPQKQQLDYQKGKDVEQNLAREAQMGIATSGAGLASEQRINADYEQNYLNAARNSADQAMTERYGLEYQQSLDNAQLRQQANLANANMDLTSQVENAKNILTVNLANAQMQTDVSKTNAGLATQSSIANAQNQTAASIANTQAAAEIAKANAAGQAAVSIANMQGANQMALSQAQLNQQAQQFNQAAYLQAIGLTNQQSQIATSQFLGLVGLQQQDLQFQDQYSLQTYGMFLNAYLQEASLMNQMGQFQTNSQASQQNNSNGIIPGLGGAQRIGTGLLALSQV